MSEATGHIETSALVLVNRLLLLCALLATGASAQGLPDIRGGTVITLARNDGEPGDSLRISIAASNSGTAAAPDFPAAVYFSDDLIVTPDDIFLTRVTIPGVGPQGNTSGVARTVVPDVPRGGYYILVALDDPDTVAESNETNNRNSARFTVSPAFGGPDLLVSLANLEDTVVAPGDRVTVEYRPANRGQSDVEDFDAAFYIALGSEFVTPRADWILLARETLGGLDAGDDDDEQEQFTVPTSVPPGDYSFFVILDDQNLIPEVSETNNTFALGLRVTGGTSGEDGLVTETLDLRASPNPSGGSVQVTYTLATAGPVQIAVYDALGRRVAVAADGARGAGAHTETLDVSSLPPGAYVARLAAAGSTASISLTIVR